jgi:hypothetical protein
MMRRRTSRRRRMKKRMPRSSKGWLQLLASPPPTMRSTCITLSPETLAPRKDKPKADQCIYVDKCGYAVVMLGKRWSKKRVRGTGGDGSLAEDKGKGSRHSWITERAHRLVLWCAFGGPAAAAGGSSSNSCESRPLLALHMCGNPLCLNPEHLVWGTHQINALTDPRAAAAAYERLLQEQGRGGP